MVLARLYVPATGKLKRRLSQANVSGDGFLDDYSFLIQGLLDLYEASFDVQMLRQALHLQEKQDQLFWDAKGGGYFTNASNDKFILARSREAYDGAEPSANSVAAMNLLRLWQMTDQPGWRERFEKTTAAFSAQLKEQPESMPYMMAALEFSLAPHKKQIVIAGAADAADTRKLLRLLWERYLPNRVLMLADGGEGQRQLAAVQPAVANMARKQGRATAYICENFVCNLPTADPQVVARLLDAK